jgi:hypothetical protein
MEAQNLAVLMMDVRTGNGRAHPLERFVRRVFGIFSGVLNGRMGRAQRGLCSMSFGFARVRPLELAMLARLPPTNMVGKRWGLP